jgi:hypothetical protein
MPGPAAGPLAAVAARWLAFIPDSLQNWFYRDKRYEVNALSR